MKVQKEKPENLSASTPAGLNIRNIGIKRVRVGDIVENPLNFRMHGNGQKDAFAAVVSELGWYGYPDVYESEKEPGRFVLIDGELRKKTLIEKYGEDAYIDVNVTDFNETEAKKALATHDPLSAMAETNNKVLVELLSDVQTGSAALQEMLGELAGGAFESKELDEIEKQKEIGTEEVMHEQSVQLKPNREYVLVFADNESEWIELQKKLGLQKKRRGGYARGTMHDAVGIERVITARRLLSIAKDQ